jgi:CubicO group peptidase (beta-lactamase class C family)
MNQAKLDQAIGYAQDFGGSGMVVRNGYRVASWGDQAKRYLTYSATKSFGSVLLGIALAEGKVQLGSKVAPKLPEIAQDTPVKALQPFFGPLGQSV